ncbi:hypothetical protein CHI14_12185 [Paenibacillus sp. 7516]|nr:hypothetical protein CHI14_12185 [Paenibacillus sp. 7516]
MSVLTENMCSMMAITSEMETKIVRPLCNGTFCFKKQIRGIESPYAVQANGNFLVRKGGFP